MRRLLYVPIIHNEVDMGAAGTTLGGRSAALSGKRRWALHQETVCRFWQSVAAYLHSFDAHRIKVYQDGLAVAGDVGKRIVKEATRRGSRNYQLVLELLNRGAELCKTEDPFLLLQERENVLGLVYQAGVGKQQDAEQYRRQRDRLVEGRDRFIAATVSETLKEGETGVLLLGAYHNVGAYLPGDIAVEFVKDPRQVRAYFKELFSGSDDERFQELARHLSSPIAAS